MNRRSGHDADADKVVLAARAEAAIWITRLHGPLRSPQLEAGFRRWLAERPENAQEFEGMNEVWELLGGTEPAEVGHGGAAGAPSYVPAAPSLRRRVAWALAACLLLALGGPLLMRLRTETESYHTGVGEQRTVRLVDGSRLTLNADSQITAEFTAAQRHVSLDRGEVLFEVAKDAARPFIVTADDRSVTALGTVFLVRRDTQQFAVTLIEGKVAVAAVSSASSASTMPPAMLHPGERLTFSPTAAPRRDTPSLEAVTAWRRGEVVLTNTPLAQAVAEMNRYDKTTIVLDSPRVATLPVSGLYHTGDNSDFATSVARMYGLQQYESDGRIHLK